MTINDGLENFISTFKYFLFNQQSINNHLSTSVFSERFIICPMCHNSIYFFTRGYLCWKFLRAYAGKKVENSLQLYQKCVKKHSFKLLQAKASVSRPKTFLFFPLGCLRVIFNSSFILLSSLHSWENEKCLRSVTFVRLKSDYQSIVGVLSWFY